MSDFAPVGLMTNASHAFKFAGDDLTTREQTKRKEMAGKTSDPAVLAEYQAVVAELAILRNAQSSTVKVMKDMAASVVANFR